MRLQRLARVSLIPLALVALLGASIGTVAGQSNDEQRGLFGEVVSVTAEGLVVETKGGNVEISVTAETLFRAPENDEATLVDLSRGDRIAALVIRQGDQVVAVAVMFVPTQDKVVHITGVVAEVADGSAVILTEDGDRVTVEFGLSGNIPEPGTVVTIVGRLDEATGVLRARSVHPLSGTLERLNQHIDEIQDAALDRDEQIKQMARVRRLLEENSARQLRMVNEVLEGLPESARPALDQALRNLEEANQAVARALEGAIVLAGQQEREKERPGDPAVSHLSKEVKPTHADIAAALGLTEEQLVELLGQGLTLAEVIAERGLTLESFEQNLVAVVTARLQALVEEGRLTPETLELIAAEVEDRVGSLIEEAFTDDDEARPDLPFSIGDLATVLGIEPSRLNALLRQGQSVLSIAEGLGVTRDALVESLKQLVRQRLEALAESGAVNAEDIERLLEELEEKIDGHVDEPLHEERKPLEVRPGVSIADVDLPFDLVLVARILGMSEEALLHRLEQGGTLAQIAEENGVSLADLAEKLLHAMEEKLQSMVEAGVIDAERARKLLAEAKEHLLSSLREFHHEDLQRERPRAEQAWSPSARLYQEIPLTLADVAEALGISVEELQEWMHEEGGISLLLKERGISAEELVAKLLSLAERRFAELASTAGLTGENAARLLAELKKRLLADLRLTQVAHTEVSSERVEVTPVSFMPFDLEVVARALGLSLQELQRSLSSGHTVAEIARGQGISLEQILVALLTPIEQEIRQAVAAGWLSEEEGRQKLARAREAIVQALEKFVAAVNQITPRSVEPSTSSERDTTSVDLSADGRLDREGGTEDVSLSNSGEADQEKLEGSGT